MQSPTYANIVAAADVVRRYLAPTLLFDWPSLCDRLGFRFFLKHENHQPTGAFKVRGGLNLVSQLTDEEKQRGVIGCSTGNHGQSLGLACQRFGVKCTMVVPATTTSGKVASMRAFGVEVIEHGKDFGDAMRRCEMLSYEQGCRYVHSANEPQLIAGVGTMGLEIFDELPDADVLLVPIGLGSGICGSAIVAAQRNPKTKVIGVQAAGASAVADSWKAGKMLAYDAIDTFAEGLATRQAAELTMDIMRRLVSDIVLVSDDEMRSAMKWILEDTRNLAEPAGAATTAAAWKFRDQFRGKTVVGVVSGGNCDLRLVCELLA